MMIWETLISRESSAAGTPMARTLLHTRSFSVKSLMLTLKVDWPRMK